ncbi:hypothetical protein GUI12_00020 [Anaplasmataceae bacterium AB001_6]|nr:hypothetical protein GUI12_00020 [Anaplasmataceae bacterium AB001_6]
MSAVNELLLLDSNRAVLQDTEVEDMEGQRKLDDNINNSFSDVLAKLEQYDAAQEGILVKEEDEPIQSVFLDDSVQGKKSDYAFFVHSVDLDDKNSRSEEEISCSDESVKNVAILNNVLSIKSIVSFPVCENKVVDVSADFESLNSCDNDLLSTQLALNREVKQEEFAFFQNYKQADVVVVDKKIREDESESKIYRNKIESFLVINENSEDTESFVNLKKEVVVSDDSNVDCINCHLEFAPAEKNDKDLTLYTDSKSLPISQTVSVADCASPSDQSECTVTFNVLDYTNGVYDALPSIKPTEGSEDVSLKYSLYYGKDNELLTGMNDAKNLYQRISHNGVNFRLPISDISNMGFMTVTFRPGSAAIIFRGENQADANVSYLFDKIREELTKLGFRKMKFNYVSYDKKHRAYSDFDQSRFCNDNFINITV